ncbi:MAG: DUF305 domain-containing protein [Hamadaea sp.]|uniref:DUF305 domain-containing protein n=1 Tax=Hamadaea sp. TaxID=2024425 RepID=UPI00181C8793|nr:DUF305 domain-containing protein [Hamadaea sp.]NUT22698.1 DUF305 domain-containing protein [Hamadaea sp.]
MPARRWLIAGGLAFAIVVSLMTGYAVGRVVTPTTPSATAATKQNPADDSPEAGFARDMSTHHAQAVEMSMIAAARATDPEVRQLGYDIALTQENQIGQMQTWLTFWGLNPTSDQPAMAWMPDGQASVKNGLMPGMASQAEVQELRDAKGKQVDILFLKLILTHHLGGIHMVDGLLAASKNPEVVSLAENMKAGQQNELTVIQNLQKKLGS